MVESNPFDNPAKYDPRHVEESSQSDEGGSQTESDTSPTTEAENNEGGNLQSHPYADMFPRMQNEEFTALVASIRDDGLAEPIVTWEGEILDGRNRYAACTKAEVEPEFIEYEGKDPRGFVLLKNLHRRHLTTSQRAMIAANMANMNQGQRTDLEPSANLQEVSVAEAAKKFNVSPRSIETAKAVLASDDKKLIEDVESGKTSVSAAAKRIAKPSPAETLPDGERESRKLRKLWDKTGDEGKALFLEDIEADYVTSGEEG